MIAKSTNGPGWAEPARAPQGASNGKIEGEGKGARAAASSRKASRKAAPKRVPDGATRGATNGAGTKSGKKATSKKATHTGRDRRKERAKVGSGAKPSTSMTLAQLADSYLHHLEAVGKSEGTVRSYRGDLNVALRVLGAETKVSDLTEKKVRGFFESDAVTKKRDGKPRNPITVAKQRRVLRLAVEWLVEVGVLKAAPIPELDEPKAKAAKKK